MTTIILLAALCFLWDIAGTLDKILKELRRVQ